MHEPNRAIRGHIVTLTGDPFVAAEDEVLVEHTDGLILIENGTIAAVGPYADLAASVPDGVPVDHYPHAIISAGFIDTHIHYVQTGMIGAFGAQLMDWFNDLHVRRASSGSPTRSTRRWSRRSSSTSCCATAPPPR